MDLDSLFSNPAPSLQPSSLDSLFGGTGTGPTAGFEPSSLALTARPADIFSQAPDFARDMTAPARFVGPKEQPKMTASEWWADMSFREFFDRAMPVWSTVKSLWDAFEVKRWSDDVTKNGEQSRYYGQLMTHMSREQRRSNMTGWARALDLATSSIGFALEFGIGSGIVSSFARGGVGAVARASIKGAAGAVDDLVAKGVAKEVAEQLVFTAAREGVGALDNIVAAGVARDVAEGVIAKATAWGGSAMARDLVARGVGTDLAEAVVRNAAKNTDVFWRGGSKAFEPFARVLKNTGSFGDGVDAAFDVVRAAGGSSRLGTVGIEKLSRGFTRDALDEWVKGAAASTVFKAAGKDALGALVRAPAMMATPLGWGAIAAGTVSEMADQYALGEDEAGRLKLFLAEEGHELGAAMLRGVLDTGIEYWSENMGETLGLVRLIGGRDMSKGFLGAGGLGTFMRSQVGKLTRSGVPKEEAGNLAVAMLFGTGKHMLKRIGYDGILGEVFEEQLGQAARVGLGLQEGKPYYNLEESFWMAVGFAMNPMGVVGARNSYIQSRVETEVRAPIRAALPKDNPAYIPITEENGAQTMRPTFEPASREEYNPGAAAVLPHIQRLQKAQRSDKKDTFLDTLGHGLQEVLRTVTGARAYERATLAEMAEVMATGNVMALARRKGEITLDDVTYAMASGVDNAYGFHRPLVETEAQREALKKVGISDQLIKNMETRAAEGQPLPGDLAGVARQYSVEVALEDLASEAMDVLATRGVAGSSIFLDVAEMGDEWGGKLSAYLSASERPIPLENNRMDTDIATMLDDSADYATKRAAEIRFLLTFHRDPLGHPGYINPDGTINKAKKEDLETIRKVRVASQTYLRAGGKEGENRGVYARPAFILKMSTAQFDQLNMPMSGDSIKSKDGFVYFSPAAMSTDHKIVQSPSAYPHSTVEDTYEALTKGLTTALPEYNGIIRAWIEQRREELQAAGDQEGLAALVEMFYTGENNEFNEARIPEVMAKLVKVKVAGYNRVVDPSTSNTMDVFADIIDRTFDGRLADPRFEVAFALPQQIFDLAIAYTPGLGAFLSNVIVTGKAPGLNIITEGLTPEMARVAALRYVKAQVTTTEAVPTVLEATGYASMAEVLNSTLGGPNGMMVINPQSLTSPEAVAEEYSRLKQTLADLVSAKEMHQHFLQRSVRPQKDEVTARTSKLIKKAERNLDAFVAGLSKEQSQDLALALSEGAHSDLRRIHPLPKGKRYPVQFVKPDKVRQPAGRREVIRTGDALPNELAGTAKAMSKLRESFTPQQLVDMTPDALTDAAVDYLKETDPAALTGESREAVVRKVEGNLLAQAQKDLKRQNIAAFKDQEMKVGDSLSFVDAGGVKRRGKIVQSHANITAVKLEIPLEGGEAYITPWIYAKDFRDMTGEAEPVTPLTDEQVLTTFTDAQREANYAAALRDGTLVPGRQVIFGRRKKEVLTGVLTSDFTVSRFDGKPMAESFRVDVGGVPTTVRKRFFIRAGDMVDAPVAETPAVDAPVAETPPADTPVAEDAAREWGSDDLAFSLEEVGTPDALPGGDNQITQAFVDAVLGRGEQGDDDIAAELQSWMDLAGLDIEDVSDETDLDTSSMSGDVEHHSMSGQQRRAVLMEDSLTKQALRHMASYLVGEVRPPTPLGVQRALDRMTPEHRAAYDMIETSMRNVAELYPPSVLLPRLLKSEAEFGGWLRGILQPDIASDPGLFTFEALSTTVDEQIRLQYLEMSNSPLRSVDAAIASSNDDLYGPKMAFLYQAIRMFNQLKREGEESLDKVRERMAKKEGLRDTAKQRIVEFEAAAIAERNGVEFHGYLNSLSMRADRELFRTLQLNVDLESMDTFYKGGNPGAKASVYTVNLFNPVVAMEKNFGQAVTAMNDARLIEFLERMSKVRRDIQMGDYAAQARAFAGLFQEYFGNTGIPWNLAATEYVTMGTDEKPVSNSPIGRIAAQGVFTNKKLNDAVSRLRSLQSTTGITAADRVREVEALFRDPAGYSLIARIGQALKTHDEMITPTYESANRKRSAAALSPFVEHALREATDLIAKALPENHPLREELLRSPASLFAIFDGIVPGQYKTGATLGDLGMNPELRARIDSIMRQQGYVTLNPWGTKDLQLVARADRMIEDQDVYRAVRRHVARAYAELEARAEQNDPRAKDVLENVWGPLDSLTPERVVETFMEIMVHGDVSLFAGDDLNGKLKSIHDIMLKRGDQTNSGLLPFPGGVNVAVLNPMDIITDIRGDNGEFLTLAQLLDGQMFFSSRASRRSSIAYNGVLGRSNSKRDAGPTITQLKSLNRLNRGDGVLKPPYMQKENGFLHSVGEFMEVLWEAGDGMPANIINQLPTHKWSTELSRRLEELFQANPDLDVITFSSDNLKLGKNLFPSTPVFGESTDLTMFHAEPYEFQLVQMMSKSPEKRLQNAAKMAKQFIGNYLMTLGQLESQGAAFLKQYLGKTSVRQLNEGGWGDGLAGVQFTKLLGVMAENTVAYPEMFQRMLDDKVNPLKFPDAMSHVIRALAKSAFKDLRPRQRQVYMTAISQAMSPGMFDYEVTKEGKVALPWGNNYAPSGRSAIFWDKRNGVDSIEDFTAFLSSMNEETGRPNYLSYIDLIETDVFIDFLRDQFGPFEVIDELLEGGKAASKQVTQHLIDNHDAEAVKAMLDKGLRRHEFRSISEVAQKLRQDGVRFADMGQIVYSLGPDSASNDPWVQNGERWAAIEGVVAPGALMINTRIPSDSYQSHPLMRQFMRMDGSSQASASPFAIQLRKGADLDGDADYLTLMDVDGKGRIVVSANNLMMMAGMSSVTPERLNWWRDVKVDTLKELVKGLAREMAKLESLVPPNPAVNSREMVDLAKFRQSLKAALGIAAHNNSNVLPFLHALHYRLADPLVPFTGETGGLGYLGGDGAEADVMFNRFNTIKLHVGAEFVNVFVDSLTDTEVFELGLSEATVPMFLASLIRHASQWAEGATAQITTESLQKAHVDSMREVLMRMRTDTMWQALRVEGQKEASTGGRLTVHLRENGPAATLLKKNVGASNLRTVFDSYTDELGNKSDLRRAEGMRTTFVGRKLSELYTRHLANQMTSADLATFRSLADIQDRSELAESLRKVQEVTKVITGDMSFTNLREVLTAYNILDNSPANLGVPAYHTPDGRLDFDRTYALQPHMMAAGILHKFLGASLELHEVTQENENARARVIEGIYLGRKAEPTEKDYMNPALANLSRLRFARRDGERVTPFDAVRRITESEPYLKGIRSLLGENWEHTPTRMGQTAELERMRDQYPDNPMVQGLNVVEMGSGLARLRFNNRVIANWIAFQDTNFRKNLQDGFDALDRADQLYLLRESVLWNDAPMAQSSQEFGQFASPKLLDEIIDAGAKSEEAVYTSATPVKYLYEHGHLPHASRASSPTLAAGAILRFLKDGQEADRDSAKVFMERVKAESVAGKELLERAEKVQASGSIDEVNAFIADLGRDIETGFARGEATGIINLQKAVREMALRFRDGLVNTPPPADGMPRDGSAFNAPALRGEGMVEISFDTGRGTFVARMGDRTSDLTDAQAQRYWERRDQSQVPRAGELGSDVGFSLETPFTTTNDVGAEVQVYKQNGEWYQEAKDGTRFALDPNEVEGLYLRSDEAARAGMPNRFTAVRPDNVSARVVVSRASDGTWSGRNSFGNRREVPLTPDEALGLYQMAEQAVDIERVESLIRQGIVPADLRAAVEGNTPRTFAVLVVGKTPDMPRPGSASYQLGGMWTTDTRPTPVEARREITRLTQEYVQKLHEPGKNPEALLLSPTRMRLLVNYLNGYTTQANSPYRSLGYTELAAQALPIHRAIETGDYDAINRLDAAFSAVSIMWDIAPYLYEGRASTPRELYRKSFVDTMLDMITLSNEADREAAALAEMFNTDFTYMVDARTGKKVKKRDLSEDEQEFLQMVSSTMAALMEIPALKGKSRAEVLDYLREHKVRLPRGTTSPVPVRADVDDGAFVNEQIPGLDDGALPVPGPRAEITYYTPGTTGREAMNVPGYGPLDMSQDVIDIGPVLEAFYASDLRREMLGHGRDETEFDPVYQANVWRKKLDEAFDRLNRDAAKLGLTEFIKYRKGYYPAMPGYGVPTPKVAARLQQLRFELGLVKVSSNEREWDPLRITDSIYELKHGGQQISQALLDVAKKLDVQNELIRTREHPKGLTLSEHLQWMKERGGSAANAVEMIEATLYRYLVRAADGRLGEGKEVSGADTLPLDVQKAFAVLTRYLSRARTDSARFRVWEDTQRSLGVSSRTSKGTMMDRFTETGKMPGELNPGRALSRYLGSMSRTLLNHGVIASGAIARGTEGEPLIFFVPPPGEYSEMWKKNIGVLETMLANAESYSGIRTDAKKELRDRLNDMADILAQRSGTYETYDSPTTGEVASRVLFRIDPEGVKGWGPNTRAALKKLFDKRYSLPYLDDSRDAMEDLNKWVQGTKILNLAASPFFLLSAFESYAASIGLHGDAKFLEELVAFKRPVKELIKFGRDLRRGRFGDRESDLFELRRNGYVLDTSYDRTMIDMSTAKQMHQFLLHKAETGQTKATRLWARGLATVWGWQVHFTDFMFGSAFPTLKTDAALKIVDQVRAEKGGAELTPAEYASIARFLNDAFGGQQWVKYWWASPKVMQGLSLLFFSPNWSMSAFNVAGGSALAGRLGLADPVSKLHKDLMLKQYWPAMATSVVMGWPNALQAAIYLAGQAFGGPDDDEEFDDSMFTMGNEPGKQFHIDITPVMRLMPWYRGGESGKRRVYVRWGKQVWEVFDPERSWIATPLRTAQGKMSTPARFIMAQMTGNVPGVDGWAMDWKNLGFIESIYRGETKGFWGSRTADFLGTFRPYSFSALTDMSRPDGKDAMPVSFIGSTSRGTTKNRLTAELIRVMMTYADTATWDKVQARPDTVHQLAALRTGVIEAATRNGIDPQSVVTDARKRVLADLYAEFATAMERNDDKRMNDLAKSIIRVQGSLSSVMRSLKTRIGQGNYDASRITPENLQLARDAFAQAWGLPGIEP